MIQAHSLRLGKYEIVNVVIIRIEERPSKRRKPKRIKIMRCDNCDVVYEKAIGAPQCKHDFCSRKCFCEGTKKGGRCHNAVQAARVETFRENWGADNVFANDEIKQRILEGNREKWGADNPMQTEAGKQLFRNAMIEKYGVENPMQLPEVRARVNTPENQEKRFKTMKRRGTIHESRQERDFVAYLELLFNEKLETHPHRDECGGSNVDCKIQSLNVYIEFDGCPWHGFHNDGSPKLTSELTPNILRARNNDLRENRWFEDNDKWLLRIKCSDWANICGLPYYKRPSYDDIIEAAPTWDQIIKAAYVNTRIAK